MGLRPPWSHGADGFAFDMDRRQVEGQIGVENLGETGHGIVSICKSFDTTQSRHGSSPDAARFTRLIAVELPGNSWIICSLISNPTMGKPQSGKRTETKECLETEGD